jgi:hypothetical protein
MQSFRSGRLVRGFVATFACICWGCCGGALAQVLDLGFAVPADFEIEYLAAKRDMSDGLWSESLRHVANALEKLERPIVRKQLGVNHSFLKFHFLELRALVLGEVGCRKAATSQYAVAQRVLENLANNRALDVSYQQALLEFSEIRICRPVLDFGMGFAGLEKRSQHYFRWKEAIRRCEAYASRMRANGGVWVRMRGKQLIEMAREKMQPHWLGDKDAAAVETEAERAQRHRDAMVYLLEAENQFASRLIWKKMFPDKTDWEFMEFNAFKQLDWKNDLTTDGRNGLTDLKSETVAKELWKLYIDDFIELRLAQIELQSRLEARDDNLAWDPDNADSQFESMISTIRSHLGPRGDNHPVIFRARLCRAKWWCYQARHALEKLEKQAADPNGGLAAKESLSLKVRSYAKDAIRHIRDIQSSLHPSKGGEVAAMPVVDEACAGAELCAHETLLRMQESMKSMPDVEVKWRTRRVEQLRAQINADGFGIAACKAFGAFGDPRKK